VTHIEALDLILANACPADLLADGVRTFHLQLHCREVEVKAKLISTVDRIQYEILDVKISG
jgi:hypothetical protein